MKKLAFTMVEILIVIIIISIITVVSILTIAKPWELAYKYGYSKIYNALNTSIYNYMATSSSASADDDTLLPETRSDFCKALALYMNTSDNSGDTRCGHGENLSNNPDISKFSIDNVQLMLSNGMRLWIGANKEDKYFTYTESKGTNTFESVKYYIVYIDLNGEKAPNTFKFEDNRLPDIVAFAVTDKYAVIPLGYPTIDKRYLSAYILYPYIDTENDTISEAPSDAVTFYEARAMAYGNMYEFTTGQIKSNNRLAEENLLFSYDFEDHVFPRNSDFRIQSIYLERINNGLNFDSQKCGDGKALGDAGLTESNCEVKIYDYN